MATTRIDSTSFKRMLRQLPPEVIKAAETVNKKTAESMAAHIRRIAPKKSGNLVSTVEVHEEADGAFTVAMGGPKTQRRIGSRTYTMDVHVGAGRSTAGVQKGGRGRIIFDYARLLEWGSKKVRKDPSFVPARRRASRLYKSRMNAAIRKVARTFSGQ